MKFGHSCPKCGGKGIEQFESVRPGGGPLSVGHVAADAFTVFSQFDLFVCRNGGYTEFYRK